MSNHDKYEEINRKAKEYAYCDPIADKERRYRLEREIWDFEFSLLKEIDGKARFPLLEVEELEFERFYDKFVDVMVELFQKYDPQKAKFSTALFYLLKRRCTDAFKSQGKENLHRAVNHVVTIDEEEFDTLELQRDNEAESSFGIVSIFSGYCKMAKLIQEHSYVEKHRADYQSYYDSFFTCDMTSFISDESFTHDEVSAENTLLFPVMALAVLCFLLGNHEFMNMDDICNKISDLGTVYKPDSSFRSNCIKETYSLTRQTASKKEKEYVDFVRSIIM